jgi:chromosomal replication initiation ATPase DnaA
MTATRQIPFDWGARSALGRDDFLISPCNQSAVTWIDRWPNWQSPALVLCGQAGCGKTHLAAVWAQRSGAKIFRADNLLKAELPHQASACDYQVVIDGIDPWIGLIEAETALFHLYNLTREHSGSLLVTSRMNPAYAPFALPDLASRLRAAPRGEIGPPDDDLLGALLVKLFHDRQITLTPDLVTYLVPRMERSFAAARTFVKKVDQTAMEHKKPVTLGLLRDVLAHNPSDHIYEDSYEAD